MSKVPNDPLPMPSLEEVVTTAAGLKVLRFVDRRLLDVKSREQLEEALVSLAKAIGFDVAQQYLREMRPATVGPKADERPRAERGRTTVRRHRVERKK